MNSVLERIEKEAFKLPSADRELLANHLLQSIHPSLNEIDEAWLDLAEQRFNAAKSVREPVLSETEFFEGIKKDLGWK